jgi:hypothetical protein
MHRGLIAILIATILNTVVLLNVKGATCDDDSIKSVTDDGDIIVMLSGHVYQVLPGDTIDAMLWLPASDVMICARSISVRERNMIYYEIINTDDKEKVGAILLR